MMATHFPFLALIFAFGTVARYVPEPPEPVAAPALVQVRQDVSGTADTEASLPASAWSRGAKQPLNWQPFRYFPALALQQPVPSCSKIGRQYPELVSRNQSILTRYASIVCDNSSDSSFLTDPEVPLTAEIGELEGGCVNMNRWPTRIFAANLTHSSDLGRTCGEDCDKSLSNLMPVVLDEDLLVISSTKLPLGMEYQHMLLDFLPAAWTVVPKLNQNGWKLVTHIPLQTELVKAMGVPEEKILELSFPQEGMFLLCTKPHRTLHLWRAGRSDGEALPMKNSIRGFEDFWHRLLTYRVGPEMSNAIAKNAHLEPPWQAPRRQITFLHRCVERRALVNEEEALALTSKALVNWNQQEELASICAGRLTWQEQLAEIRRSILLIGAHGGQMANSVFSRRGAGMIEIVNSPEAHNEPESGRWPPYKSHWYGGAGAAMPFFRVVLYERNAADQLEIRLDDLEEALHHWFAYKDTILRQSGVLPQ